jgi:hypothetical protein
MRWQPIVTRSLVGSLPVLGVLAVLPWLPRREGTRTATTASPFQGAPTDTLVGRELLLDALKQLDDARAFESSDAPTHEPPESSPFTEAPPVSIPRAVLVSGVVVGPTRTAFLDGLPGLAGVRAIREGERINGILVTSVQLDRVTFQSADSTWSVPVRRLPEPRR